MSLLDVLVNVGSLMSESAGPVSRVECQGKEIDYGWLERMAFTGRIAYVVYFRGSCMASFALL